MMPLVCLSFALGACGSHWVQGAAPGILPLPSDPIKRELIPGDLRVALNDCVAKFDSGRLSALNRTADDKLTTMLAGDETLEFNKCMSSKGWISMTDTVLAP
jgi:hypothetical protein